MSDNHFNYIHMTEGALKMLDDDEDEKLLNEPLPEEGKSNFCELMRLSGLVPPLQEEEDNNILPTASHPSFPYGNPYTLSLLPLRPSARSTKKGLKGNPHTRHMHTWTDLALEDLLPWEGEEPDLNYFAGLEAEAAAAAHAAAAAAAGGGAEGDMEVQQQGPQAQEAVEQAHDQDQENSEDGSDRTDGSE
ncbi:MAG: hypothetical protein CYPHOPRED_005714 [Cyphobasidiales sp. Tagirdzhanova-0007]|nr:MAG: hypothetical protein CYPHOPRED_005714 [Cyphobasidiales sp. Tagirdzhanova-0007]